MINFKLVSLTGVKYDEEVYEVVLPTQSGEIAIFKDHMPLITNAVAGVISVRKKASDSNADMDHFAVDGGLIETNGRIISFLADDVVGQGEVNEAEALKAMELAQKRISQAKDKVELSQAQNMLASSSARLQVAKLKKRHHN
jgi:F-type H+-transporting ATPase subunit epsilon